MPCFLFGGGSVSGASISVSTGDRVSTEGDDTSSVTGVVVVDVDVSSESIIVSLSKIGEQFMFDVSNGKHFAAMFA
jgi:hypothetical protein